MSYLPALSFESVIRASLTVPPTQPGFCLTPEAIKTWADQWIISAKPNQSLLSCTIGTIDQASEDDRDKPRLMVDDTGRYLGMAIWLPELQGWSIGGQIGELKTIVKTQASVALDMQSKALAGWKLADGSTVGIPDLTPKPSATPPYPPVFFRGTSPDWEVYTVAYVGGVS